MPEVQSLLDLITNAAGYVYDATSSPSWNMVKTFACGWIATNILRFKPAPEMRYRVGSSMTATALFVLCIMELAREFTGSSPGVSPFVSMILLILAYRLQLAGGNISKLTLA